MKVLLLAHVFKNLSFVSFINQVKKRFFILICVAVCIIALFVSRFFQLSKFPVSLTHDEIVYAIQAQSFLIQGTTADQSQSWWSLRPVHPWYAELPAVLMAPFFLVSSDARLNLHLLAASLSVLFPFVFSWFMYQVWSNKKLAYIAWVVGAINPLWWQFGRLSYDAVFSTFFYFFAAALFLSKKKVLVLLSVIMFFFGFFQYQGLKLILLPWIVLLLAIKYFSKVPFISLTQGKVPVKRLLISIKNVFKTIPLTENIVVSSIVILFFSYVFVLLPSQNVDNRLEATLFGNPEKIAHFVNSDRRISLQNELTQLTSNKASKITEVMVKRFFKAFNPLLLFVEGEANASGFAVWSHGIFYLLDAVLIIIGLFVSLTLSSQSSVTKSLLLLLFIPVLSIPTMINISSEWYLLRTFMSYTVLLVFISWGLFAISQYSIKYVVFSLYFVSVIWFCLQFYNRYPVYSADAGLFSERLLSEYIDRVKTEYPQKKIVVYTVDPPILFSSYLVHSGRMNQDTVDHIAQQLKKKDPQGNYQINGIRFSSDCVDTRDDNTVYIAEYWRGLCSDQELAERKKTLQDENRNEIDAINRTLVNIPTTLDNGAKFHIYHDPICHSFELPAFVHVTKLDDFDIEQMSRSYFCQKWITTGGE